MSAKSYTSGSQSEVPRPAALASLGKANSQSPAPDLLNQKLWGQSSEICVLTRLMGDFDVPLKFETTGLDC